MKFVFRLICALHYFLYPYSPVLNKKKKERKNTSSPLSVIVILEETKTMKFAWVRRDQVVLAGLDVIVY